MAPFILGMMFSAVEMLQYLSDLGKTGVYLKKRSKTTETMKKKKI